MYKICFFVPALYAEQVKQALFDAGAGCIGDYEHCAWETVGTGQFRPMTGSTPFIGSEGTLEKRPELKVEMVCADTCIQAAVDALRQAHPYETPAFEVWKVERF